MFKDVVSNGCAVISGTVATTQEFIDTKVLPQ